MASGWRGGVCRDVTIHSAFGLPALCCDAAGLLEFAATAERLSATTNATAKSVVFTIFLLWVFPCRDKKPILLLAKWPAEFSAGDQGNAMENKVPSPLKFSAAQGFCGAFRADKKV